MTQLMASILRAWEVCLSTALTRQNNEREEGGVVVLQTG